MKTRAGFVFLLLLFCIAPAQFAAAPEPSLGQKIIAYCKDHKGQQVGDGQCAALAYWALKDCGAKRRGRDNPNPGDYVWGDPVLTVEGDEKAPKFSDGKSADLRPGDILQFRDAHIAGQTGKKWYSYHFHHHTAVLGSAQGSVVQIWQQNVNDVQTVSTQTLRLSDMKEGWIRFYRPVPRGEDSAKDEAPKEPKDDK